VDAQAIRQAISLRPFQPFRLRLADGRELTITHPESAAVSQNGRVVLFTPEDSMVVLEPLLVVSLGYAPPPAAS
jgi:hypothetical protein